MQEEKNALRSRAINASNAQYQNTVTEKDRRVARRLDVTVPVEVRSESPFNPQTIKVRTRNISAHGLYFICGEGYMVGQLLHVTVRLPVEMLSSDDDLVLSVRCRVQRVNELMDKGAKRFGVAVALEE